MEVGLPTISVVIPAYNAEAWIADTLTPILGQTAPPLEVIVVDDGSTDGTPSELERFLARITVIRQRNQGCGAALNSGFAAAKGDYVAMVGADDVWETDKLQRQLAALQRDPAVDVSFCHARYFGLDDTEYERPPGIGRLDAVQFTEAMYERNLIAASTSLIRRTLYERLGGFRDYLLGEDYEFWMRALRAGAAFHYEPRLLVKLRRHGDNLTGRLLETREADYTLHREYAEDVRPALAKAVLAGDLRQIARFHMDAGRRRDARRAFRASLAYRRDLRGCIGTAALSVPGGVHAIDRARRLYPSAGVMEMTS
jgi:glycosyltransferase involved in cell wall biosynthesis